VPVPELAPLELPARRGGELGDERYLAGILVLGEAVADPLPEVLPERVALLGVLTDLDERLDAFAASPSGTPTTPAWATDGCSSSVVSTSPGPTRYPDVMMTSSLRDLYQK